MSRAVAVLAARIYRRAVPRRVCQPEIRAAFGAGWRIDAIEASRMPLRTNPEGARAWLASITRAGAPPG